MEYRAHSPLDELGLKAGCLPFRATGQGYPPFYLGRRSIEHSTDAMRLRLHGAPFEGMQNPYGLEPLHGQGVSLQFSLTKEFEIPIPCGHAESAVFALSRMPTRLKMGLEVLISRLQHQWLSLTNQLSSKSSPLNESSKIPNVMHTARPAI